MNSKAMKEMAERLRADALHNGHDSDWWVNHCVRVHKAADTLEASANTLQTPVDSDVREAISSILQICDGSNWLEDAQSGPKYEAYSEITEQLHDIAAALAEKDKVKP